MSAGMVRILVAQKTPVPGLDDAVAHGVRVVGTARTGTQLLARVQELRPDVVLADRELARASALGSWVQLIDPDEIAPTVLLFLHGPMEEEVRVAAAFSCVVPERDVVEIFRMIRTWWRSVRFVFDSLADGPGVRSAAARLERLSPREREVLELICEDVPTREIAVKLDISPRTVDAHRSNLMKKLGLHTTVGLVRLALAEGWVDRRPPRGRG